MSKSLSGKVETLALGTGLFNRVINYKDVYWEIVRFTDDVKQFWVLKGQADSKKYRKNWRLYKWAEK